MEHQGRHVFRHADGALIEVPEYSRHSRGKNWMAKIAADPRAPGGLGRTFAERANGRYYYMLEDWMIAGVPVEFGADYYSGRGRKSPNRWYGLIIDRTPDILYMVKAENGPDALRLASEWAGMDDEARDEVRGGSP